MKKTFLLAICVLFCHNVAGQGLQLQDAKMKKQISLPFSVYITTPSYPTNIPQDLYSKHLPFFCRQELKLQKANIPMKFRLGGLDDCNKLEQKPGYK